MHYHNTVDWENFAINKFSAGTRVHVENQTCKK